MSSDDQTTNHGSAPAKPTYDSTLTDIPDAQRDQRITVASHQKSGGFPGWQYLASNQRQRLIRWRTMRLLGLHQRAYSYGVGGATCICGLIVNIDPATSGRWLDFFSAPGHLDINTGEPARIFFAQGGPYRLEMWCASCGDLATVPREVFEALDDDLLSGIADAHTVVCKGQAP